MNFRNVKGMGSAAVLVSALSVLAATGLAQRGPGWGSRGSGDGSACLNQLDSLANQPVDTAEAAGLAYMREEEKLARDVYAQLFAKWGSPVFANISQSELRHFEALKVLLDRYGLTDPAAGNAIGVFSNPGLQALFGDLVKKGEVSLAAAFRVGALIEDRDIHDLDKTLAETDNADLKLVYQHLQRGSRNHLRAFASQLSALGETYAAQYITSAALTEILASPWEAGMGRRGWKNGANGAGRGNGTCPNRDTPANPPGAASGRS